VFCPYWDAEEEEKNIKDKKIAFSQVVADRQETKIPNAGPVIFVSLVFLSFFWQEPVDSGVCVPGGRHRPRALPGGAPSLLPVVAFISLPLLSSVGSWNQEISPFGARRGSICGRPRWRRGPIHGD
jgi:hypothetical protein